MNGNGTQATPWEITTITQLAILANYVNAGNGSLTAGKYYKLMNDLDYNSSFPITSDGWSPIGNFAVRDAIFQGNFNGNGKMVSNLRIDRDTTWYIGLFGYVSFAHIHDLGVEVYPEIIGGDCVGGLIGRSDGSTIKNCYALGSILGVSHVGGLVGLSSYSTIFNSYAICEAKGNTVGGFVGSLDGTCNKIIINYAGGNVTATREKAGGFVGVNNYHDIIDCYAVGDVTGVSDMGGFAGSNHNGTITNCYASGDINAVGDFIGGFAGSNSNGVIINCVAVNNTVTGGISNVNCVVGSNVGTLLNNYAYNDMEITPNGGDAGIKATMTMLKSFNFYNTGSIWYNNTPWSIDVVQDPLKIWKICDNETLPFLQWEEIECDSTDPCDEPHAGTFGDPFLICTVQDLVDLANYVNSGGTTTGKYWKMMNDLDLGGISNWNPIGNSSNYFQGDFDGNGKVISNLTINRGAINYIGLFSRISNAEIKNLGIETCQIIGNECVGALIGGAVSGISTIANCYVTDCNISGYRFVGGLIGYKDEYSNLTINNCYTIGSVTGTGNMIGGLIGLFRLGTISNSHAICEVNGASLVGGLVGGGTYYGIIEKSYAGGNVMSINGFLGGLVGAIQAGFSIYDCYATGNVTVTESPHSYIGGLVGVISDHTNISNCYATGNITIVGISSYSNIGVLVGGVYESNISNCYATSTINGVGSIYLGGLVGFNSGILINCVAANSNITGAISNINRIAGANAGILSNNYAYEDMLVNGVTTSGTHNNLNGESKPMPTLMSYNFYNTGSNWYNNTPWNIDLVPNSNTIWGICDDESLPFFQWEGFNCSKKSPQNNNYEENYMAKESENHLLTIVPNPVSGIVTITATDEMQQLYIFDITGRLLKSQTPASKNNSFDTSILPHGIYIVQARLKEGGVQMGKLVVR